MSKRWFDLLATIGFAFYFFLSCSDPYYIWTNKMFATNGFFLVLIFALRRFFYNKEKKDKDDGDMSSENIANWMWWILIAITFIFIFLFSYYYF